MEGHEAGRETATTGRHLCRRGRVVGVSVVLWFWTSAQKEEGVRVSYRDQNASQRSSFGSAIFRGSLFFQRQAKTKATTHTSVRMYRLFF